MYRVNVVAASVTEWGKKVITLECEYPRIIHAEARTHRIVSLGTEHGIVELDSGLNTDRDLSRNASSSRAIPTERMLKKVREDPAMPASWGKNQKGMQADQEHSEPVKIPGPLYVAWVEFCSVTHRYNDETQQTDPETWWRFLAWAAMLGSKAYADAGYHKQIANRPTEPYQWMTTLITATEWDNFFELRDHKDADPTFQALAKVMRQAKEGATYEFLQEGQWHLPYILPAERLTLNTEVQIQVSTARCARVSIAPFDGNPAIEKELERHNLLVGSKPWHASPTEHICTPARGTWGNFKGWRQYRQVVEGLIN